MTSNITTNWKQIIEDCKLVPKIEDKNICPSEDKIFRCFNFFNWEDTKIVILGQDPYHTPGQATGLAFECNSDKMQPSLKNICKVLGKETINFEEWAKKGVLLLNTALTTVEGKAGAHLAQWKLFTKFIIQFLNDNVKNVVFVCWGLPAIEACSKCKNVLTTSHPSPLGAHKALKNGAPAFLDSKIFDEIHKITGIKL
jgi:uracil-DNA glycosylase